jgi:membrane-associated phospholipid phosphatase
MKRRVATAAAALAMLLATTPARVHAQAGEPPAGRPGSYLRALPGILTSDLLSLPRDATDAPGLPYLIAGVGMTIAGPLGLDEGFRNEVRPPSAAMRDLVVRPFQLRARQLAIGTHSASLGILTAGWLVRDEDIARWGAALWETVLLVDLTVIPLKIVTGRKRPGEGDATDFEPIGKLEDAFPSWHSAWSMATARLVAGSDAAPIIKGLAWLAATGITAQRVLGDKHWLSDTVAGSLLGIWIGSRVTNRRFGDTPPSGRVGAANRGGARLQLSPAFRSRAGRAAVGLRATFRFGM